MPNKFVLLIEDNADDELLTLRAFQKGHIHNEIIVVRDGEEALEFLFCTGRYASRDKDILPQVILLDLKLPKIDGHQVLEAIRKNEKTELLPVIILTSSREEKDLIQGYSNGANSYIVKPVDTVQFTKCVQDLGLYWLVLNERPARAKQ
jgi:two-component system response regulator